MSTFCNDFAAPLSEMPAVKNDCFKVFVSSATANTNSAIISEKINSSCHDDFARQEFNRKRTLIIRNTPVVTYAEVKAYMGRFSVADISISKRQQHAIVTLKNGGEAEAAVSELSGNRLADVDVKISLYRADNLLWVTGLPADVIRDDHEFRSLAEVYGPLEKCFLMRASDGHSKGYGIVEFAHNREKSEQAKCKINGIRLGSDTSVIQCGFVSDSVTSFEELHSRCLKISRFPPNTTNAELLAVFSKVALPVDFEIAHCDNKANRFALVEFLTGSDAERTVRELKVSNCTFAVQYCAPGETPAEILHLIRTLPISEPVSKYAVEVCPAVINMIENNPQGIHGSSYTSQSDRLLLTNPSFQIALLAVLFAGQQQGLPGVGEPMMLQAAAMIEKHCSSSVHGVRNSRVSQTLSNNPLLPPFSMLPLNPPSIPTARSVALFVTDSNEAPPVLPFSNPIHPLPNAVVPQMSFPPDIAVPFTAVPPPSLHSSQVRSNSVVPFDTAMLLAISHPPPPLHLVIEPYSVPHLASKLCMPQLSCLPMNALALPNSAPQSSVGLHQSAFNTAKPLNFHTPILPPSTVLPIASVPPPTAHTVLLDNRYMTTPLGTVLPPCSQSLPSAMASCDDWFAPAKSTTQHVSTSVVLAPSSVLSLAVHNVNGASIPRESAAKLDDVPCLAVVSPPNKRKVLRAIVGRRTQDLTLKNAAGLRSQENKPSLAAFTETISVHGAYARPNNSRVLTDSVNNIQKSAVVSVIGQKRSRITPTCDDGIQLPVTPVADHTIKSNFIQSPEPSPDSGYVGQHSQGIGGHYADSYFTKRRKFKE